jgi:hypothetical protein
MIGTASCPSAEVAGIGKIRRAAAMPLLKTLMATPSHAGGRLFNTQASILRF